MTKRQVFIVAADPSRIGSESDFRELLRTNEAWLLQQHPGIDDPFFRLMAKSPSDIVALDTFEALCELREALEDAMTPAWKIAVLGIKLQDMVRHCWQPVEASARGRVHRKGTKGRGKQPDVLTMRVLKHLRASGNTWKTALRELEQAAETLDPIDSVEIDRVIKHSREKETGGQKDVTYWIFRTRGDDDQPDQVESFATLTLERVKWSKSRSNR